MTGPINTTGRRSILWDEPPLDHLADARQRFASWREQLAIAGDNRRLAFVALRGMAVARRQIARLKVGSAHAAVLQTFRFANVACSQCGREFGPGDHGFSSCASHRQSKRSTCSDEILG